MRRLGQAAITWTSTEDTGTEHLLHLESPLRMLRPGISRATFTREALDRSQIATYSLGASKDAYELVGSVRYSHNTQQLVDCVRAGSRGLTLTYFPDLSDPDVKYACTLLAPLGDVGVEVDRDREPFGDHQLDLRLRLTTGNTLNPLWLGTPVLFSYAAGDELRGATFTRVTSTSAPASYAGHTGGGGFGTLTTAKSGKARLEWVSSASSVGPRTIPTLLFERSRKNLLKYSEDFSHWAGSASASSGQSDPGGGTKAWKLTDTVTTEFQYVGSTKWQPSSNSVGVSGWMKAGTAGKSVLNLLRVNNSSSRTIGATWSSGVPTVAYSGLTSYRKPERWRGGWYRFFAYTTALTASTDYRMLARPAASTAASTGYSYFFGMQVEE